MPFSLVVGLFLSAKTSARMASSRFSNSALRQILVGRAQPAQAPVWTREQSVDRSLRSRSKEFARTTKGSAQVSGSGSSIPMADRRFRNR